MESKIKTTISDISFIGSGISSSFTLLHFLEELKTSQFTGKLHIDVIDKYNEFHTGIPYGNRSGFSVLLITSLKNFLPEPELSKFIIWLSAYKEELIANLKAEGGELTNEWIETHKASIAHNDWEDLFIPRRFFGIYIDQKINNLLQDNAIKDKAVVNYLVGDVVDLVEKDKGYQIIMADGSEIQTNKAILSVGSLPVRYLWGEQPLVEKQNLLFVNDPYNPGLSSNLQRIQEFVNSRKDKTNVLIVGANASALEILYKLNDNKGIKKHLGQFAFLSTLGLLPDSIVDTERQKDFIPQNLQALQNEDCLTAKDIADATYKDLDLADEISLGAASTVEIISQAFGRLLGKLDTKELKTFACLYGNDIGRRQRCAGYHYSKTIESLKEQGAFEHIAGRFEDLSFIDGEFHLSYLDTATKEVKLHDTQFHIIINCVGSTNLERSDVPILIKNVLDKNYASMNESRIGFNVNDNLEASTNLHVIGPLLAGNIFEGKAVWHLEHCGRIMWLSKVLADRLINEILI